MTFDIYSLSTVLYDVKLTYRGAIH